MSDEEDNDDYDYEDAVSEVPSEEPIEAADATAEDGSDEESENESVFTEEDMPQEAQAEAPRARADPVTASANTATQVIVRPADQRITDHRLQKSEASHIISVRAQQIARSATNYVAASPALALLTDPCEIAHRELIERRCRCCCAGMWAGGQMGRPSSRSGTLEKWHCQRCHSQTRPPKKQ